MGNVVMKCYKSWRFLRHDWKFELLGHECDKLGNNDDQFSHVVYIVVGSVVVGVLYGFLGSIFLKNLVKFLLLILIYAGIVIFWMLPKNHVYPISSITCVLHVVLKTTN